MVITQTLPTDRFKPMQKGRSFADVSADSKSRSAKAKRSLDKLHVRFIGDVGIINALQTLTAPDANGVENSRQNYYTSVWAKRNGVWQVVNAQFTPVPEASK